MSQELITTAQRLPEAEDRFFRVGFRFHFLFENCPRLTNLNVKFLPFVYKYNEF